jgi:crotonobetainyl-CoA:carnitine CoA-transferase CaiB-like acyl-CoA transferase
LKHCHILVENFKVGDLKRYGLDFETLHVEFPQLVYCSVTGFGQTGPYAQRAGYDYAVQGMGGLMSVTGERDDLGGGPQKVGVAVADLFTGLYATVAILAALRHAERTGEGQHIDMALLDTQLAMLANLGANCLVSGQVPGRAGNAHQNIVPYQVFEVAPKADGSIDHIIVAVGNDQQYAKFCAIAEGFDASATERWSRNPAYARNVDRVKLRAALVPQMAASLRCASKSNWLGAMEAAGVPGGPINDLAEAFADPQVAHREMIDEWQHPLRDKLRLVASPIKMSATPTVKLRPPPRLGEHTQEVLRELGITPSAGA